MQNNNILIKKINEIVEKEKPYGILLVGSLARMNNINIDKARDVDIFVIIQNDEFEREVVDIGGLEFDISYISIKQLDLAINNRISSVICVLNSSKILYNSDNGTLNKYLKKIKEIYDKNPLNLGEYVVNYTRFKLSQDYLTVQSRLDDYMNFEFLSNIFIKDLLKAYFKLNNLWMPPDKRILKSIKDEKLKQLIDEYYSHSKNDISTENRLKSLKKILNHIIKPFGGELNHWEKGYYPFDFE